MLVPRSYSYSSTRRGEQQRGDLEKKALAVDTQHAGRLPSGFRRGFGWRPESFHRNALDQAPGQDTACHAGSNIRDFQTWSGGPNEDVQDTKSGIHVVATSRSSPMPVPQGNRSRDRTPEPLSSSSPTSRTSRRRQSSTKHDPNAMPASVAALLAMTSIPRPKGPKTASAGQRQRGTAIPRRMSTQQLMEYWKEEEDASESGSFETGSSLDILLSPPDHEDMFPRSPSFGSLEEFSAESMPSLSVDERSVLSWSRPLTPQGSMRRATRDKTFSLPKSCESISDHPLSLESSICEEQPEDEASSTSSTTPDVTDESVHRPSSASRRPSTFKSNLTASLSALRSSLRSLSNFASTPYAVPEDHLSRGLFSDAQRIRSEMRPRPLKGIPTPELRRYLNPSTFHYSPSGEFHLHGSHIDHVDYGNMVLTPGDADSLSDGSIIALQDRLPALPLSDGEGMATAGASSATEAGRAMQDVDHQHRREIRENSEFLRICVLETNMRRAGKIEGPGRARVWLPARRVCDDEGARVGDPMSRRRVPQRWIGIVA